MIPFPSKKYQIIYADPPWEYELTGSVTNARGLAKQHYQTMTTEELCNLPVAEIAGGGGLHLPLGNIPNDPKGLARHGGVGLCL